MTDNQGTAPPSYQEAISPPQDAYPAGFAPQPVHTEQASKGDFPPQGATASSNVGAYAPQGGAYAPQGGPYPPQGGVYAPQGGTVIHTGFPQQTVIPGTQVIARCDAGDQPPDYMLFAVIVTFFCCLPIGLVALMKAMEARNRWQTGDVVGAHLAAQEARKWCIMSLVIGVIVILIFTGLLIGLVAI